MPRKSRKQSLKHTKRRIPWNHSKKYRCHFSFQRPTDVKKRRGVWSLVSVEYMHNCMFISTRNIHRQFMWRLMLLLTLISGPCSGLGYRNLRILQEHSFIVCETISCTSPSMPAWLCPRICTCILRYTNCHSGQHRYVIGKGAASPLNTSAINIHALTVRFGSLLKIARPLLTLGSIRFGGRAWCRSSCGSRLLLIVLGVSMSTWQSYWKTHTWACIKSSIWV